MPYVAPAAWFVTSIVELPMTVTLPVAPVTCATMPNEPGSMAGFSFAADVFGETLSVDAMVTLTFPVILAATIPALLSPLTDTASFPPVVIVTLPLPELPEIPVLLAPTVTLPATAALIATVFTALELSSAVMVTLPVPIVFPPMPTAPFAPLTVTFPAALAGYVTFPAIAPAKRIVTLPALLLLPMFCA